MASRTRSLNSSSSPAAAVRDARAAAAERRLLIAPPATKVQEELKLKEKRNTFQRLIEPGIIDHNPREQALASLKTLQKLAINLINKPHKKEFTRFRINNDKVKKLLIEPKGVLEYAVEMGFREKAEDYESFYVFCDKFTDDLKLGAEILEAHILVYEDKKEMEFLSPVRDKVLKEGDVRKVRLQIVEDRMAQKKREQVTRQIRERSPEAAIVPVRKSISAQPAFQGQGRCLAQSKDEGE